VPPVDVDAHPCEPVAQWALDTDGKAHFRTSGEGRFCVDASLATHAYTAQLVAAPTRYLDGSTIDVPIDPSRRMVKLRFDAAPVKIDLDDETPTTFEAEATTDEDGEIGAAAGLALRLTNEAGALLANAVTDVYGAARFEVLPRSLGPAGPGELRVAFDGSADDAAAAYSAPTERIAHVELVQISSGEALARNDATLEARAELTCARRGCSGVPTGSVEIFLGATMAGVGPLVNGTARVATSHPPLGAADLLTTLRYVPDAPWFVAAGDRVVVRPERAPNRWGNLFLGLASLLVVGWLVATRWQRKSTPEPDAAAARERSPAYVGVAVVRTSARAASLAGHVLDVHDAVPLAASVRIERPSFEDSAVVAATVTNAIGRFELPLAQARAGDELIVESRWHETFRTGLPRAGEINVALISRRRKLLDDLVSWARRRGGRFDARPEPTPEHVRSAATGDHLVADWAAAVEKAAYGDRPVDEAAARDVVRLAPTFGDPRPGGPARPLK
jgi:hypothetical protein